MIRPIFIGRKCGPQAIVGLIVDRGEGHFHDLCLRSVLLIVGSSNVESVLFLDKGRKIVCFDLGRLLGTIGATSLCLFPTICFRF